VKAIVVVTVDPKDAWPCEVCDDEQVIAYVAMTGAEETHGYCRTHLGTAVLAAIATN
jgi:hypothetical protein